MIEISHFRCAVHYSAASSDDQDLYRRLKDVDVYESDNISKTMTLSLNGVDLATVRGAEGGLHVESSNGRLSFYVPKDKSKQALCFLLELPQGLATYLGITDQTASKLLGDIIKTDDLLILDMLFDRYGIVRLSWPDPSEHDTPSHETFTTQSEVAGYNTSGQTSEPPSRSRSTTPAPGPHTPPRASSSRTSFGSPVSSSCGASAGTVATSNLARTSNSAQPRISPVSVTVQLESTPGDVVGNDEYIALLAYVIAAAAGGGKGKTRLRVELELTTTAEMPAPIELSDTLFGRRSENQIAHDIKIGAAGELYVRS